MHRAGTGDGPFVGDCKKIWNNSGQSKIRLMPRTN